MPSVGKGDNVVDLDAGSKVGFLIKDKVGAGVGLVKFARDDGTVIGRGDDGRVAELATDNALAERTAVDGGPRIVKFGASIAGFGGATLDLEL